MELRAGPDLLDWEVVGGAVYYHPGIHLLLEPSPWLESLRRHLALPELFEYFHRGSGNFCLGGWYPTGKSFMELECYDKVRPWYPGGDHRYHTKMEYLEKLRISSAERAKAKIRQMKAAHDADKKGGEDDNEQRKELAHFMRQKGMGRDAMNLVEGRTPWVGAYRGGSALEQLKYNLKTRPEVYI